MLTTLDPDGTKSTVTASPPLGIESVAVSPVSDTRRSSSGRARWRTSSRPSTRSASATSRSPSRYGPPAGPRSTSPASSSVAASREAVLALTPIRRASSLTPSPDSLSASASSTSIARATDPTGRRGLGLTARYRFARREDAGRPPLPEPVRRTPRSPTTRAGVGESSERITITSIPPGANRSRE